MQNMLRSTYYQMKGISHFVWLPPIILYILLPTIHYVVYSHHHDMDMLYNNILENGQYVIPLFSVWYVMFLLYHLVEQPGCELLYVTETFKWHNIMLLYVIYVILMLPLFIGYTYLFPEFWWLYIKLCIVNLLYTMSVYAFTYIFRRIIPGILLVLFYTSMGFLGNSDIVESISYYSYDLNCGWNLFYELVPIICVSVVFCFLGMAANYNFTKKGFFP